MSEYDKKWYVAHTLTNSEKRASRLLASAIALESESKPEIQDMFGRILVPEIESIGENGKSRSVVQFRGYIFVECELNDVTKTIIRATNRISRVTETPIPDAEVRRLLGEEVAVVERDIDLGVEVGEEVDIIDGPFVSMTARVVEIDSKNQKIKVGVMMFGRTNTVDLEFKQVRKAQIKSEDN